MQPGRRNASAPEGTSYGMVLLAKTAALVALVAIGGWHRRTTLPLLAAGRPAMFLRLVGLEVLVFAVTLELAVELARTPLPAAAGSSTVTASAVAEDA
ncbi:MAG: CopD family protein [Actinomycetota bacterium]|nr:CopD family protein [Actinomycetota bacterium]